MEGPTALAPVIPLRPLGQRVPNCLICRHARVTDETYCPIYQEVIDQESVAALDCPSYAEDEDAR